MKITVPATSANLGPGFDSVGLAVSKYLTIDVLEESSDWEIRHDLGDIPTDKTNLLIKTALDVYPDLQPHLIQMTSDIPLARGLGSSSSVIVAGIELANQLAGLNLSAEAKLEIATRIEGHPDNVAPAIFGNLVIARASDHGVDSVVAPFPDCDLIAFIPNYELKTSDSRGVLPKSLAYKEAVEASAVANLAVAGLLTGDMALAGRAIESDLFHENYRQQLVKEVAPIKALAKEYQAYATYLSGAGPTVMTFLPSGKGRAFAAALSEAGLDGQVAELTVDHQGVRCE